MSNFVILLTSILASLILIQVVKRFSYDIYRIDSARICLGFVLLQLILISFFPVYKEVVIGYVFLYLVGINQHLVATPLYLKEKFYSLLMAPIHALLTISIIGSLFVGFSVNVGLIIPAILSLSLLQFFFNLKFNRYQLKKLVYGGVDSINTHKVWLVSLVLTLFVLVLIFPVADLSFISSPYRFGPDLASYSKMAQYLLDGGTLRESTSRLLEFEGMTVGELNRYGDATMSWPFVYFFRWGLLAYLCVFKVLMHVDHAIQIAFLANLIPYLLICGLVCLGFIKLHSLSPLKSILLAVTFGLNANLLNLWYEGFYANLFVLVFFTLLLYLIVYLRVKNKTGVSDGGVTFILFTLIFTAILFSYPEIIFFVFSFFIFMLFLADYIIFRGVSTLYFKLMMSLLLSLGIVTLSGALIDWMLLAVKQLGQQGGNGYPQPYWAMPHEILGIQNIYLKETIDTIGKTFSRSAKAIFIGLFVNIFIGISVFKYGLRHNLKQGMPYLIMCLAVVLSFVFTVVNSRHNNYTYMKMYVVFLPFLFMLFFAAINSHLSSSRVGTHKKVNISFINTLLVSLIVVNGINYVYQFRVQRELINSYQLKLQLQAKNIDMNNVIFLPFFESRGHEIKNILHRDMLGAILTPPWIIRELWIPSVWGVHPYSHLYENRKVFLFIEKASNCFYDGDKVHVILENRQYLIVDSRKHLIDGVNNQSGVVNYEKFNNSVSCK